LSGKQKLMEDPLVDWLNTPEIKAFRGAWQAEETRMQAEDQAWWDSLNIEERARCFRQMMKLMHKAEIRDRGSYRYAMYDVFGVDYCDGLAHYMDLHNAIYRGLEADRRAYRTDDEDVLGEDTIGP
jgi:hypothetical protein